MCLFTSTMQPQIAKKPIKVYKMLIRNIKDRYDSVCGYANHLKVGDIVKAKGKNDLNLVIFGAAQGEYMVADEGVHAYVTLDAAKNGAYFYDVISEWEIPAGTKYWLGDNRFSENEIAATEMKFIKICK
jgi:hypothetical protein